MPTEERGPDQRNRRRLRARLVWSAAVGIGVVVAATLTIPSFGGLETGHSNSLLRAYNVTTRVRNGLLHAQRTKNFTSRSPDAREMAVRVTHAEERRSAQAV